MKAFPFFFFLFCYTSVFTQTSVTSNITSNTTWTTSGSPYNIDALNVTVEEGVTLTIEPGVEVHFNDYNFHLYIEGTLDASGEAGNLVRFYGALSQSDIYYGGIVIRGGLANLDFIDFERNGPVIVDEYVFNFYSELVVLSGELNLNNSRFRESPYHASISLGSGSTFNGANNEFQNFFPAKFAYIVSPDVPMSMTLNNNNYTGNSGIIMLDGSYSDGGDVSWSQKEIPYSSYFTQISGSTNLTIEPGVEVKFYEGGVIYMYDGSLIAEGTNSAPILFNGGFPEDDSYGGTVALFSDDSEEVNHYFENCIFQQMENGMYGTTAGYYLLQDTLFSLKSSTFEDINENALYLFTAQPILFGNCFSNIGDYAILNEGVAFGNIINANNNFWDDASGPFNSTTYPNGQGEEISGGVIADFPLAECPIDDLVDLAVGNLLSPALSSCEVGSNLPLTIRINNIGNSPVSDFQLQLRVNNNIYPQVNPNLTIQGLGSIEYTFAQTIDINYFENNEIEVSLVFPNDQNTNNNTATFFIESTPFDGQTQDTVEVCSNENSVFLSSSGGVSYLWSTGSTAYFTFLWSPIQEGDYYVTITNSEGCTDVDTVSVLVNTAPSIPTFFQSSNFLCFPNGTMTLTVQGIADNLIWSTGETTPSITVNQPGFYTVTHIDDEGCSSIYQEYIYYESVPTISNDIILCDQNAVNIYTFAPNGSTYQWSNNETTSSISVAPLETTIYSVTITTPNNCVHVLETTVTVASEAPPGPISNMLPLDGTQNIALPFDLSWSPGDNATNYNVFIWLDGNNSPANPTFSTSQISQTITGGLSYGNTYNWKVCTQNICGTTDTVCSTVQQFSLNYLPDLIVPDASIVFPDTVFSGTEIELEWDVLNQGLGSTQGVSSNGQWYDVAYLSTDMTLSNDDLNLGYKINPTALSVGASYNNTLTFQLPNGIEGEYFLIVCTDRFTDMPESDETNNCGIAAQPITIQLSPFPDLVVTSCPAIGAGGIILAGGNYDIQWTVENQSNGINSGPTQSGSWYDRIYISTQNECNGTLNNDLIYLGAVQHQGDLEVGESYTSAANIQIPDYLEDTVYLFILTDVYNNEYEYVFESNNCCSSEPYNIPIIPKPDFELISITAPDTASNREYITISWTGQNNDAVFDGSFSDRVFISEHPDFSGWYQALGSTSQNFSNDNLQSDESYTGEDDFQIPSNITGKFYLLVYVDGFNEVEENIETNNAGIIDSICINSPNLTVTNIETIPDAFSGQTITVNWEIANIGIGDLLSTYVVDRVKLINVNNASDFMYLGTTGTNLTLFSNGTISRQLNYNIPNGFTGDFCLEVETNYNQGAYENGMYSDNSLLQCDTFHILSTDYPNLVAEFIDSFPLVATAGESIELTFKVRNDGNVATSDSWFDRIYISTSDVFNSSTSDFLAAPPQSQIIASGGFYEEEITVQLPTYLEEGDYYLHLLADSGNAVFETNQNDNAIVSANTITISAYPETDLQFVGTPIGPATLTPGQSATLTYEVKNEGTVVTTNNIWKDGLFLSPNPSWEPSDVLLEEWLRTDALNAGETYARQESFTLPAGFTDAFYLCLVIDYENAVAEDNESNNYIKILQQNGDTITIVYPPNPDLAVSSCNILNNAIAGQPLSVDYTIQNISPDGNANGTWTESFYLSTDQTLNSGDQFLGQKNHAGGLTVGNDYSDMVELTLPLGASGNYFMLVKTDGNNNITEGDETNNVKSEYLFITQSAPGDLVVNENNIIVPIVDTIATDITISWLTKNIGQNPISGYMEEGVYLSEDTLWDASDILLETWKGNVALDPNTTAAHSLTARLENVKRQDYYVFVKTDLLDHFLENNEANNCSSGINPVFIEVLELPIGFPVTAASLDLEAPIYYRIEIPTDTIGETMRVSITSTDLSAFNELYVRHNDIPSRTEHDFTFGTPFSPGQEIIIPAVGGGTYYVMAYAVDGIPTQDVELLAEIIPFQITSIEANQGGNTGFMTAILEGAKFEQGMVVQLEKEGLPTIIATEVNVVNSTKAFVTFQLEGVPVGIYDVIAIETTNQDTLENGFEIITGSIGNTPLQTSCSFTFSPQNIVVTNVPTGVDIVELQTNHLPFARPNQVIPITIRIKNTGDVDIPAPTRIFDSINGFPVAVSVDNIDPDITFEPLTFEEMNGPPNILRPGGIATIIVYTKATQSEGVMKFKLNTN